LVFILQLSQWCTVQHTSNNRNWFELLSRDKSYNQYTILQLLFRNSTAPIPRKLWYPRLTEVEVNMSHKMRPWNPNLTVIAISILQIFATGRDCNSRWRLAISQLRVSWLIGPIRTWQSDCFVTTKLQHNSKTEALIGLNDPDNYSLWPRAIRRQSEAARLLGWPVWIPPGPWISASCECCVLSGWSLVQRSPPGCGVSKCDREALIMRKPWPTRGCWVTKNYNLYLLLSS